MWSTVTAQPTHRAVGAGAQRHVARFGVLGPLVIWQGPQASRIAAAKHRTVLAVLLAHANQPVSIERLVDELWPDAAPETARKTLQGYVWRLRRTLGRSAGQLATVDSGYQLVLSDDGLDLLEFDRAVRAARVALTAGQPETAARGLAGALRLWRGAAYAGVARTPLIEAQAARLEEAKLGAHELLLSTRLHTCHHREVIPELVGLVSAHPGRESLHRLLMAALFHAGRRLDALEAFAGLRRTLATNYGLDPDRETMVLHQAILRDAVDVCPATDAR